MAQGILGNLLVKIGVDSKEFNARLAEAKGNLSSFSTAAEGFGKVITGIFSIAALTAVVTFTKRLVDFGDQLNTLSLKTGLAASEIARLKYIAEQSETSIEAVVTSFKFLSRNIAEASQGGKEAVETFRLFQTSFKNADGTLRSYKSVLLDLADRIRNTKNETLILAEGQKLFGRNFQEILPLLRGGREEIERLAKEYDNLAPSDKVMNDFAEKADLIKDTFGSIATAAKNAGIVIVASLITPFVESKKEIEDLQSNLARLQNMPDVKKLLGAEAPMSSAEENFRRSIGSPSPTSPISGGGMTEGKGILTPTETAKATKYTSRYGTGEGQRAPSDYYLGSGNEFIGQMMAQMSELKTKWQGISTEMANIFKVATTSFQTSFATAFADMIGRGVAFKDAMKGMWESIKMAILQAIGQMIAQLIILFAWQVVTGTVGQGGGGFGGGGGKKFFGLFRQGGYISARNGLLYGANGFATTGHFGETGIPAVVHPGEVIAPIDKFFNFMKQNGNNISVTVNGDVKNPREFAEFLALEVERQKRSP